MKKDQDLVVGQLALKADLISSDQLTLATEVWAAGKTASMGEVLESRGFVDATGRAELERLAERGDVEADDPAMSTLMALSKRSRDPAELLTVALPASNGPVVTVATHCAGPETVATNLAKAETLETQGQADPNAPTVGFEPPSPNHVRLSSLVDLGSGEHRNRYARTHIHARGGIGQVWLARDGDLGREVALKELRPEQGRNSTAWSRFVEEARITGQLEHPGIVPVYELSVRPEDGKPFYTMRFIRGKTLSQAIRDYHEKKAAGQAGPLDLASLLTAFVSLCNTAGYAHSRGVIHRDLKGHNVVLGDFGEVMLLDWGIAKLVDQPRPADGVPSSSEMPVMLDDGSAHDATVDGQVLGTPFYMAPEQAEGRIEAIDARTDVYGLGAILYEILTGRPPYEGSNTIEVLRKVREEAPPPPRQVDPRTPRALEAVCLKAMARRPEDRYPTALALADEVRRWLADEPVSVLREPWATRMARWSKRHRTAVASAAALLMTAVVALSVSAVLIGKERDEARRQGRQARKAVDDSYTRVAENWLADRLDPLQREFLEKALVYYRDFAGPDEGDPGLRQDRGRAYLRMGDVLRKLGRHDEAEAAYRRAIEILSKLAADVPAAPEHRDSLAEANFRLGSERAARGKAAELEEAERLFRRAASAQEALLADAPSTPRRVALGRALGGLADLLRVTGPPADSESAYRRAIALLETASADEPAEVGPRQELGAALDGLGILLKDRGRSEEAKATGRRAIEVLEKLVADVPTLPSPRDGLARAYNSLGLMLRDAGTSAESEAALDREVALNRRLADDYPARPEYRRTLARGLMNLGIIYREANRPKEADAAYSQALKINEKLAAESPEIRKYARDQARCLNNLGELRASRKGEAEPLYRKALEIYRAQAEEAPGVAEHRIAEAGVLQNLGVWLSNAGRVDESIGALKQAVASFDELAVTDPADPARRRGLAKSLDSLGNAYLTGRRFPEAEEAYRRAVNAYDELVARPPVLRPDRLGLAACLSNRGSNQTDGKLPGAEDSLRRSLDLLDVLASEGPTSADLRFRLAAARNNLGEWLASVDRPADAEVAFRNSLELFGGLAAEFPASVAYKGTLGQVRSNLGEFLVARGRPDDARALLEEGIREEQVAVKVDPSALGPLRKHLATLASLYLGMKAHAEAAKAGEDLLRNASDVLPWARAEVARLMARCVPVAEADDKLTRTRRALIAGSYADRAIALLRESIERGDPDADALLQDRAFDPIRGRDGFKVLEPEKIGRAGESDRPIR